MLSVCLSHSPAVAACGGFAAVVPVDRRYWPIAARPAQQQHNMQQQMQVVPGLQLMQEDKHELLFVAVCHVLCLCSRKGKGKMTLAYSTGDLGSFSMQSRKRWISGRTWHSVVSSPETIANRLLPNSTLFWCWRNSVPYTWNRRVALTRFPSHVDPHLTTLFLSNLLSPSFVCIVTGKCCND